MGGPTQRALTYVGRHSTFLTADHDRHPLIGGELISARRALMSAH
jgi:hypothetical protein